MAPERAPHVTHRLRELADSGHYTFLATEHDMSVVFGLAEGVPEE